MGPKHPNLMPCVQCTAGMTNSTNAILDFSVSPMQRTCEKSSRYWSELKSIFLFRKQTLPTNFMKTIFSLRFVKRTDHYFRINFRIFIIVLANGIRSNN